MLRTTTTSSIVPIKQSQDDMDMSKKYTKKESTWTRMQKETDESTKSVLKQPKKNEHSGKLAAEAENVQKRRAG